MTVYIERWSEIYKAIVLGLSKDEFGYLSVDEDAYWDAVALEIADGGEGDWEVPS